MGGLTIYLPKCVSETRLLTMVPRLEISGQIEQKLNRVQFFFPLQIERAHCLTAHPSLIHRLGNETSRGGVLEDRSLFLNLKAEFSRREVAVRCQCCASVLDHLRASTIFQFL